MDVARSFKKKGASCLHLVDLDGAKDGQLVDFETIRRIVEEVDLFVEVGGGIGMKTGSGSIWISAWTG